MNPLQYSCLENPMDRKAWQATANRVTKSNTTEATLNARTNIAFYILMFFPCMIFKVSYIIIDDYNL